MCYVTSVTEMCDIYLGDRDVLRYLGDRCVTLTLVTEMHGTYLGDRDV